MQTMRCDRCYRFASLGDSRSAQTHCIARDEHNRQFVLEAKARYARFFKTVEKRHLTDEQIEAALAFDDLNLTVAAAGSGKTSVIVAKLDLRSRPVCFGMATCWF